MEEQLLESVWSFKTKTKIDFTKNQDKNAWLSNYISVCSVNTIEDFWRLWSNILGQKLNKQVEIQTTVHSFFKDDIEPAWEHAKNKNGCSIHFYINDAREFALVCSLMCIGNEFDVNGCTFDIKPKVNGVYKWKVSIWLPLVDSENIKKIKEYLKKYSKIDSDLIDSCRIDEHH